MKKSFRSLLRWNTFAAALETYMEAKVLKLKKYLNPLTSKIGFGIYFYKNITVNLNSLNKGLLDIAEDCATLQYFNKLPSFISVVDGINASMFSKLPNHVINRITSMIYPLPGFKALRSASRSHGYKCELHYNQGNIFFGSLQIHFKKIHNRVPINKTSL